MTIVSGLCHEMCAGAIIYVCVFLFPITCRAVRRAREKHGEGEREREIEIERE